MEKMDYPVNGNGKSTEQQIQALRSFLNELVDIINYNFELIENAINEIVEKESEE